MIKEELAIEKENLNEAVENIKMLKKYVDNAINFMNEKFEVSIHENKELKDKNGMLLNENEMLNDPLSRKLEKKFLSYTDASSKPKDSEVLSGSNRKLSVVT